MSALASASRNAVSGVGHAVAQRGGVVVDAAQAVRQRRGAVRGQDVADDLAWRRLADLQQLIRQAWPRRGRDEVRDLFPLADQAPEQDVIDARMGAHPGRPCAVRRHCPPGVHRPQAVHRLMQRRDREAGVSEVPDAELKPEHLAHLFISVRCTRYLVSWARDHQA
jgi:hypothetical protein